VKKACAVDQYGALPMDGSKEDGQAGVPVSAPMGGGGCCTEKLYWDVTKKACDVGQYEAPPMDDSKNGQAGAPATATVAKGLATPARCQRRRLR
jgi:hypothetical protein